MKLLGKMYYSKRYITELIQEAVKRNIWFSHDELDFFKTQRMIRENKEKIKREQEEEERIQKERKVLKKNIKEEQRRLEEIKKFKRQMLQPYIDQYKRLKKFAKREVLNELDNNVIESTNYRNQFFEVLFNIFQQEEIISDEDINILKNTMYIHPEFITVQNLKLMIINEGRKNGFKGAETMVTALMEIVDKPDILDSLSDYRVWLKQQIHYLEIKKLQKQGLSTDQISKKLHITTAEVIVFGDRARDSNEIFKSSEVDLIEL